MTSFQDAISNSHFRYSVVFQSVVLIHLCWVGITDICFDFDQLNLCGTSAQIGQYVTTSLLIS